MPLLLGFRGSGSRNFVARGGGGGRGFDETRPRVAQSKVINLHQAPTLTSSDHCKDSLAQQRPLAAGVQRAVLGIVAAAGRAPGLEEPSAGSDLKRMPSCIPPPHHPQVPETRNPESLDPKPYP